LQDLQSQRHHRTEAGTSISTSVVSPRSRILTPLPHWIRGSAGLVVGAWWYQVWRARFGTATCLHAPPLLLQCSLSDRRRARRRSVRHIKKMHVIRSETPAISIHSYPPPLRRTVLQVRRKKGKVSSLSTNHSQYRTREQQPCFSHLHASSAGLWHSLAIMALRHAVGKS
jgi:hypothetical protein